MSVRSLRRYMSRPNGADKVAVFFWFAVDFAWCQEEGEMAMGAAAVMMLACMYKLSITTNSPHEVLHCCSVLLWASGNISWMYLEFGQARRRKSSDYPSDGVGAEPEDFYGFRLTSLVFFFLALAVELVYYAYLRHTAYFEGSWETGDPDVAQLVRRNSMRGAMTETPGLTKAPRAGGGGGGYGAIEDLMNNDGGEDVEDEMHEVLPRCPTFFKTWNDYESAVIMAWIGKDVSWMCSTKFDNNDHHDHRWGGQQNADFARWSWVGFTCLVFIIQIDFLLTSINTNDTVEWVNYFSLFMWLCSQTLWAAGEIFLHESVVRREPVLEEPDNYNNLRWYAGWFALLSVIVLYSFWFGKSIASISVDMGRDDTDSDNSDDEWAEEEEQGGKQN